MMKSRSKLRDPGIFLTTVLVLYSVLVFAWWPKEIYWLGVSLVAWLMFLGLFLWFILGVIYVIWIEKIEDKQQ